MILIVTVDFVVLLMHLLTGIFLMIPVIILLNFYMKTKSLPLFRIPAFYLVIGLVPLGVYHLIESLEFFEIVFFPHGEQAIKTVFVEHFLVLLAAVFIIVAVYHVRKEILQPLEQFGNSKKK